ncbi:MAG: hypothetical protein FWH53_08215, partial [Leptospirales bacterium]|nr:hypothetical protein [Leptospirales bacterium]
MEYTPRQQLEIKGAFYYIVGLAVTFGLNGAVLQYFGNAGFRAQIENLIFTSFSMTLAITVYVRKKKGLKVTIIPWILGFSTTSLTYVVKYSHALTGGWTFALNSINTTGILIICVVMLA